MNGKLTSILIVPFKTTDSSNCLKQLSLAYVYEY